MIINFVISELGATYWILSTARVGQPTSGAGVWNDYLHSDDEDDFNLALRLPQS